MAFLWILVIIQIVKPSYQGVSLSLCRNTLWLTDYTWPEILGFKKLSDFKERTTDYRVDWWWLSYSLNDVKIVQFSFYMFDCGFDAQFKVILFKRIRDLELCDILISIIFIIFNQQLCQKNISAFWYKELMIASKPWSEVMLLMILPMMWLRRRIWSVINHVTRFAQDFNLTTSQRRANKQLTHSLALQHTHTHTAKCYSFTVNIKSELL